MLSQCVKKIFILDDTIFGTSLRIRNLIYFEKLLVYFAIAIILKAVLTVEIIFEEYLFYLFFIFFLFI